MALFRSLIWRRSEQQQAARPQVIVAEAAAEVDEAEEASKARDSATKLLESIGVNRLPFARARAQAKLALGSGFWRSVEGEGFRIDIEPVDPLHQYGSSLPAWDVVSYAWLKRFEQTFREPRVDWLKSAAFELFTTLAGQKRFQIVGTDSARYQRPHQRSEPVSNQIFLESPRTWRLHRIGSVMVFLNTSAIPIQEFRQVTFHLTDEEVSAMPAPSIVDAIGAGLAPGNKIAGKRKRGNSFVEDDKPWIEEMYALQGIAKNTLDAAREVINKQINGKTLKSFVPGNNAKVERLRRLFSKLHGPWRSSM